MSYFNLMSYQVLQPQPCVQLSSFCAPPSVFMVQMAPLTLMYPMEGSVGLSTNCQLPPPDNQEGINSGEKKGK